jgi:MoaA/NifB/PqqE/SkfB family radical SAM enzyme
MLTAIHFLLTYKCDSECDHCFLYCGPHVEGTFTGEQIREILGEAKALGTVGHVCFEGGEPFLFYPLMLEGIKAAAELGFETSVVTNAYWATSAEDAELWLSPFRELGVADVSLSDDAFHYGETNDTPPKRALAAAEKLGVPVDSICIEEPTVVNAEENEQEKGAPVVGGGAKFRGRAVEKLTEGLPRRPWDELVECPYEDLESTGRVRVHVDSYGNVHICQGLLMGNAWEKPFAALVEEYDAGSHPICGPLVRGGPAELAREYGVEHEDGYVDECHLCYVTRLALLDRFPEYLGPPLVYGLEQ